MLDNRDGPPMAEDEESFLVRKLKSSYVSGRKIYQDQLETNVERKTRPPPICLVYMP